MLAGFCCRIRDLSLWVGVRRGAARSGGGHSLTLIISQDGAEVSNAVTLQDAPAVRITGSNVRFTNTEDGRLISSANGVAALIIEGGGAIVTNELGGIISAFADDPFFPTGIAIQGSGGNDTILNYGRVAGDISLGGGNDSLTQAGFFTGGDVVSLGAGDDVFAFQPTSNDSFVQEVHGGDGHDTLRLLGDPGVVRAGTMSGMEALDVGADIVNLSGFSGFSSVTLAPGGSNNFVDSINPDADLFVRADPSLYTGEFGWEDIGSVSIANGSVFRSVTGTDGRENVQLATGTVLGDILLLGGNDSFTYMPAGSGAPAGGLIDGGAGRDHFQIFGFFAPSSLIDMSDVRNFESLTISTNGTPDIVFDFLSASGFDTIRVETSVVANLIDSDLPAAAV